MMFEWYSMFAYTRRPALEQAFANTSADALIPLPWGPPIIHVSRFFCTSERLLYVFELSSRRERDTLGEIEVPASALWGAQTQRAIQNYPISGLRAYPAFIRAFVRIKRAAALANAESGRLDAKRSEAILAACDEVLAGQHLDQFVVDVFHSGAGVSFHMNVNEVLANRANQILGSGLGTYEHVNPNDHVNMAQSTNDTTPTAMRLAALELTKPLCEELDRLAGAIDEKAERYAGCVKPGRTHLQDAVPITFGQEFSGWAERIRGAASRLRAGRAELCELGIGGSAAGTAQAAQLELNVMMPGIRFAVCFSATILANAVRVLRERTIEGLTVDEERAKELMDMSPSLIVTALSPHIGYAKAAALVKRALAERRALIDVALDEKVMKEADLRRVLDPLAMTKGGVQK